MAQEHAKDYVDAVMSSQPVRVATPISNRKRHRSAKYAQLYMQKKARSLEDKQLLHTKRTLYTDSSQHDSVDTTSAISTNAGAEGMLILITKLDDLSGEMQSVKHIVNSKLTS
ncbi:hypothetical protein DPMN_159627 [Dreissena polymorpha]|uniref:Uncharacterized protein n=1 Tax=Dreissena polymorpha TaxID=45954 RepID=A0A9D4EM00_DREPO|nr:hypothetical protein DPMN_159627 [Dreissena polymorpha]